MKIGLLELKGVKQGYYKGSKRVLYYGAHDTIVIIKIVLVIIYAPIVLDKNKPPKHDNFKIMSSVLKPQLGIRLDV